MQATVKIATQKSKKQLVKTIYNPRNRAKHFYTIIYFPSLVVFIEKLIILHILYKLLFSLKTWWIYFHISKIAMMLFTLARNVHCIILHLIFYFWTLRLFPIFHIISNNKVKNSKLILYIHTYFTKINFYWLNNWIKGMHILKLNIAAIYSLEIIFPSAGKS